MEELDTVDVHLTLPELFQLFDALIECGIVNLDGQFGRRVSDGRLVMYDFGVSYLSENALYEYVNNDVFHTFPDFYKVDGLTKGDDNVLVKVYGSD